MLEKSKRPAGLFKGLNISVTDKKTAFSVIASTVARIMQVNRQEVLASLIEREEAADTALVAEIAIPHIILKQRFSPWFCIFKTNESIEDWDCLDGTRVTTLICLVAPHYVDQDDKHFAQIRQVINKLAEDDVILRINKAKTAKQIIDILTK